MPVVRSVAALRETVSGWKRQGFTVGFVPTMGALHEGHLALVREAGRRADRVVASVFDGFGGETPTIRGAGPSTTDRRR